MEHSDEPEQASEAAAQVNDIFDAVEAASAVGLTRPRVAAEHAGPHSHKGHSVIVAPFRICGLGCGGVA